MLAVILDGKLVDVAVQVRESLMVALAPSKKHAFGVELHVHTFESQLMDMFVIERFAFAAHVDDKLACALDVDQED